MPSQTIKCTARTWSRATTAAVSALRLQPKGPYDISIQATAANVMPTDDTAGHAGEVIVPALVPLTTATPLEALWPDIPSGYVWVYSAADTEVSVSYAG